MTTYYAVWRGKNLIGIYPNKNEAIESAKRHVGGKWVEFERVDVEELGDGVDIMNLKETYDGKIIWSFPEQEF